MTGSSFSVKLKSKKGQFIVNDLNQNTTLGELKARIAQATAIQESQLHVLVGYPPKPLDLSANRESQNLKTVGIHSGETLIVEEKAAATAAAAPAPATASGSSTLEDDEALARRLQAEEDAEHLRQVSSAAAGGGGVETNAVNVIQSLEPVIPPEVSGPNGNFNGILLKKVVPADNSCLFTSIRFVLNGKVDNEGSEMMRHIIAQEVSADTTQYSDAVLGKSNAEYCAWIQKADSWGGAIEVSILSNYYGIEIDVVDIQNAIINRFGEDKNFGLRVFLLFDGIHYDPLYMETLQNSVPATIFPVEEMGVYQQAEQIANEAKSSRQFTNVDKFTLRCMDCDVMLVGQVQAQEHAKSTGHTNFGEI
ncbi:ubiquitin thioesterase OTU1 [Drosophila guanche]|uniref:Ubiquitin thioesterase OTU n=1 Tax=Drosophila guanche TaxID=7266 RepID=A0A3B0KFN6_DROGU|nr:ubiquitin thioesterase OTU1 [Drosophila guanche]SPP87170.1 blast:Ubiquitin thioesterase OTU1 [Drosophila guanche]